MTRREYQDRGRPRERARAAGSLVGTALLWHTRAMQFQFIIA